MLIRSDHFPSMSVISLHTSRPIAKVAKLIVDPSQLKILGFHVTLPDSNDDLILLTQDIREITHERIIVDSEDDMAPAGDLHRLKETLELNFQLDSKPVITESRQKLGTVADFSVDLTSYEIGKIHVQPTLMKRMLGSRFLIDRSQIVAVTDHEIIVNDALAGEKQPVALQA